MENQVLKAKVEMLEKMVDRQPLASLAGPERGKVERRRRSCAAGDHEGAGKGFKGGKG